MTTNTNLELVETETLVNELISRHDLSIIILAKFKQGKRPSTARWIEGPTLEVLGLFRLMEQELLHEVCGDSEEDQTE